MFVDHGSTVLHKTHVTLPSVNADPFEFEKLFIMDGFNACLRSTDATYIGMVSCAVWKKINQLGPKLNTPSSSHNETVTYFRKMLGTTSRHHAKWNDKIIVLRDELIRGAHEGKLFNDKKFTLLECDEAGEVVEQQC